MYEICMNIISRLDSRIDSRLDDHTSVRFHFHHHILLHFFVVDYEFRNSCTDMNSIILE